MPTDLENLEHIYSECCLKVSVLSRICLPTNYIHSTLSTKLFPIIAFSKSLDIRYEKSMYLDLVMLINILFDVSTY